MGGGKDKGEKGNFGQKLAVYCRHSTILFRLTNISLTQFKNYSRQDFSFQERIVGICGNNGVGKTNLLDAIYYLCFTRSYFARSDQQHVQQDTNGFRLEGHAVLDGKEQDIVCMVKDGFKKEFLLNGIPYDKFSGHIGKLPCVMIAPDDVLIITGSSEERRRFIDALISQLDPKYLQALITYNKVLQQRNGFLKSIAERRVADHQLLDVYDEQLDHSGKYIYERRLHYLKEILAMVSKFYATISESEEPILLKYESPLQHSDFAVLLRQYRDKDILLQRTTQGIHRDDIAITLNHQPFRTMASQGQRKSLLFALKLAEYETLKKDKGFFPILLLDDVFEKLDARRMHNLLHWVCIQNEGQIFITDTHPDRIREHLSAISASHQLIELSN